jgi:hypothetical protein
MGPAFTEPFTARVFARWLVAAPNASHASIVAADDSDATALVTPLTPTTPLAATTPIFLVAPVIPAPSVTVAVAISTFIFDLELRLGVNGCGV